MSNKPQEMKLNPSTVLLVPLSKVNGGKVTESITIDSGKVGDQDEGSFVERKVKVTIDNVEERETAEKLVQQATHVIRRASVSTMIGYLAPKESLATIDADLALVRERASNFNQVAKSCQVQINCLPIEISVALGPEAARALADHVRDELTKLRDDLRAGDVLKVRATLLRSRNLSTLSVGVQAESIDFAIEEADTRLREIKESIKASESPESAGRSVDVSMIESAIGMFTYRGQPSKASPALPTLSLVGGV